MNQAAQNDGSSRYVLYMIDTDCIRWKEASFKIKRSSHMLHMLKTQQHYIMIYSQKHSSRCPVVLVLWSPQLMSRDLRMLDKGWKIGESMKISFKTFLKKFHELCKTFLHPHSEALPKVLRKLCSVRLCFQSQTELGSYCSMLPDVGWCRLMSAL